MSSLTQVVPLAGVEASAATFMHEARMLHGLRHRCVVQLAGVALHGDKALLIMEFMVRLAAGTAGVGRCNAWGVDSAAAGPGWGRHVQAFHTLCPPPTPAHLQEGRDLFSALNLRDKSGERVFSWYKRGKRVALDVASALAFLHARKVMHFDVKVSGKRRNTRGGLADT